MNQTCVLCQISRVVPSHPRPARILAGLPALLGFPVLPGALILILGLFGGCSGGTPDTCPQEYPMSCPAPAPSFAADVEPLVQSHCAFCHGPGQQIPRLDTYQDLSMPRTQQKAFFQIQHCFMPPAPQPPLTAAERDMILSWLVCGAVNN
jgi:hypothetical protein